LFLQLLSQPLPEVAHLELTSAHNDVREHICALEHGCSVQGLEHELHDVLLVGFVIEDLFGQHELLPVEVDVGAIGEALLLHELAGDRADLAFGFDVHRDLVVVVFDVLEQG